MTRGIGRMEALTLIGMVTAIGSLFLPWARVPVASVLPLGALYAQPLVARSGFAVGVHWPLTLGALLCGACLLWTPDARNRAILTIAQIAGALTCLVLALTHFASLPGPLVALVAAALLSIGAAERVGGQSV